MATRLRTAGLLFAAVLACSLLALLPATAGINDYPYRSAPAGAIDRWGFTERQCTSFVAWRLAQHRRPINNYTQHWGDAGHWDVTARRLGKRVTTVPQVGSVAQWHPYETSVYYLLTSTRPWGTMRANSHGHNAYVVRVWADGSVTVKQYNLNVFRGYSVSHVRAPRFLYLG